jgi:hypothetical protein
MCLPAITDVRAAHQHDAVTQSHRAQLLDLGTTGGKAKLRAQGIDEKRICELSQYTLDENHRPCATRQHSHTTTTWKDCRATPMACSLHPPQLPRTVSGQ